MVCELCNITTLHITFISNLFCKYGKNLLPLQTKNNNNLTQIPSNLLRYDYQAFTGGGATDFCFLRQCNVWRVSPFSSPFQ